MRAKATEHSPEASFRSGQSNSPGESKLKKRDVSPAKKVDSALSEIQQLDNIIAKLEELKKEIKYNNRIIQEKILTKEQV